MRKDMLKSFIDAGQWQLTEAEGMEFLRQAGIDTPESIQAVQWADVRDAAQKIGYPLVLKGQMREVTHKSDLGLVRVNIRTEEELKRHFDEVTAICRSLGHDHTIMLEKMVPFETEYIAAVNEDPVFGKTLMFGLGGIYVEVFHDVTFGICPISRQDAYDMIRGLRSAKLFEGVRGRKPADVEKLADFLMALGGPEGIAAQWDDAIKTVEINPAVIGPDGNMVALDAVVTLKSTAGEVRRAIRPVDMRPLFLPKAVAIVGVSEKPSMAATFMQKSIEAGFDGDIYPINPKHDGQMIFGRRAYATLRDVPKPVDYAYVAVPAKAVPGVIRDAAANGTKFVHIISGGFAEVGSEGKALEEETARIAREAGVRLVGPNCMGVVSTQSGMVFTTGVGMKRGGISLISQSGGITTEMLRAGTAQGLAFNKAASIGNCADLGLEEFLDYLADDETTRVIGIYAENIRSGHEFALILKRAAKKKPVVILKGGRSSAGAKAAASHTGALSSSYALWQAMCRQCGATLVRTLEEFLNALMAFQNLKVSADNSLLLVSHSGGVVVTSTDLCEDYGLTLPKLDQEIQRELKQMQLPPGANVSNPMDISLGVMAAKSTAEDSIDIIGDIFRHVDGRVSYAYSIFYLMADNVIESGGGKALINNIIRFAIAFGGRNGVHPGRFILAANSHTHPEYLKPLCDQARERGVTVFPNINEMLQSIGWVCAYGRWLKREGVAICE